MSLQRKNWNVCRNDDQHREQSGPAHFVGGVDDDLAPLAFRHVLFVFCQTVHDVFNHNHCAVHNDAKVHRAQAQQVGGYAHDLEAQKGRQQGEWNDQDHSQAGPKVGQENIQNKRDQQGPFHQILEHGGEGFIHQPSSVVERHNLNAFGQRARIQLIDLALDALEKFAWILAFSHHDNACHDIVVIVLTHCAQSRHCADFDLGNVANQNGRRVARCDHNLANVFCRSQQTNAANGKLLRALRNITATRIGIASTQGIQ